MAFLETMKELITNKPAHLKSPYFYKADSSAQDQLDQLKKYLLHAPEKQKPLVEQDIKLLEYGIAGESSVAFELKNSYLPIIVLHDLYFEHDGLTTQIDFLVITTKFTLVIECKNLYGNLEVNSQGDFIRKIDYAGNYRTEGIYSPITQNIRHIEMIRQLKLAKRKNFLTKALLEKYFDDYYKTIVVLANPKTVINLKYAKKEIKNQIIRCDQLIDTIKTMLRDSKEEISLERQMYEQAEFFMSMHRQNTTDYTRKYSQMDNRSVSSVAENYQVPSAVDNIPEPALKVVATEDVTINLESTPIYQALKQYRYDTSKAEGIKAYFIFNNAELEELIKANPRSLTELRRIHGFGEAKCQKYGQAILDILRDQQ